MHKFLEIHTECGGLIAIVITVHSPVAISNKPSTETFVVTIARVRTRRSVTKRLGYETSGSRIVMLLDITHPSSSLHHLFPPPRDTSVLSRLRTATRFPRPVSRTKKYCSFINYALNHYQVPSCNSQWAWPFSSFRRFIVLFTCF